MKLVRSIYSIVLLVTVAGLSACGSGADKEAKLEEVTGTIKIAVVNYPLKYFAEQIGGDKVVVEFPAPQDVDPAFWEPTESRITAYQEADLILLNGANYAKWTATVSLPENKMVDTSKAFSHRFIETKGEATHSHGGEGEHSHAGTAFTTWLDFDQARLQAQAVRDALIKMKPDAKGLFEENYKVLEEELKYLDSRMLAISAELKNAPLVASHPVYQYLARRYRINIRAVLWEPETVPSDEDMEELKKILGGHKAKLMIWEGEPAAESVAKLKELGLESVVFAPCGNEPASGNFRSAMRYNVSSLEKAATDLGKPKGEEAEEGEAAESGEAPAESTQ